MVGWLVRKSANSGSPTSDKPAYNPVRRRRKKPFRGISREIGEKQGFHTVTSCHAKELGYVETGRDVYSTGRRIVPLVTSQQVKRTATEGFLKKPTRFVPFATRLLVLPQRCVQPPTPTASAVSS